MSPLDEIPWFTDCKTRKDYAREYAFLLQTVDLGSPSWKEINAEILERYTMSGLIWIKTRAWRIAQGCAP